MNTSLFKGRDLVGAYRHPNFRETHNRHPTLKHILGPTKQTTPVNTSFLRAKDLIRASRHPNLETHYLEQYIEAYPWRDEEDHTSEYKPFKGLRLS